MNCKSAALGVVAFSGLTLGLSPAADAATCGIGKIADLPVTMSGARPLVAAKINGVDVNFVADTGAFFSTLTPAAASQFHLSLYGAPPYIRVVGVTGEVNVSMTRVKELTLAATPIQGIEFIVGGSEMGGVGLLGENVLGMADAEYDLANGVIRLIKTKNCDRTNLVYWDQTKPFSVAPLEWPPDRFGATASLTPPPKGDAYVNGHHIRVVFDTGASASVLSQRAAAAAGVTPETPGAKPGMASGAGRRIVKSWVVPVASFKIGDEEIKNTQLVIAPIELDGADMLLGADFFLSHHVFIANSEHKLFFTYNGGPVFNLASVPLPPASRTVAATTQVGADAGQTPVGTVLGDTESEPKDAAGYSRRGEGYLARRDFEHALADLTKATELAPTEPKYFYQRAMAHIGNKQFFLGMADLDQTLKLKPDDVDALVTRANLRLAGRDNGEGLTDLDAADRLAPKESNLRLTMGMAYNHAERFDKAIAQFDLWIAVHRDDSRQPQALNGRCWARAQLGQDLDRALRDCNDAMGGMGLSARANRALVRLRRGDYDQAIADYDVVLTQQPKYAWGLYGRGLARRKKGQVTEGEADIAAATALQPGLPAIIAARGIAP